MTLGGLVKTETRSAGYNNRKYQHQPEGENNSRNYSQLRVKSFRGSFFAAPCSLPIVRSCGCPKQQCFQSSWCVSRSRGLCLW